MHNGDVRTPPAKGCGCTVAEFGLFEAEDNTGLCGVCWMCVVGAGEDEAAGAACLKVVDPGKTATSGGVATAVSCAAVLLATVVQWT